MSDNNKSTKQILETLENISKQLTLLNQLTLLSIPEARRRIIAKKYGISIEERKV